MRSIDRRSRMNLTYMCHQTFTDLNYFGQFEKPVSGVTLMIDSISEHSRKGEPMEHMSIRGIERQNVPHVVDNY